MAIGFGSPATSANVNASLMSRTQDTDTVGKIDVLNATDSSSTSTGALHTTGGLGVEKKAFIEQVYIESLVGSKALVTSASKEVIESSASSTEVGYLAGVTSGIQAQIDNKANDTSVVHNTGNESVGGEKTFTADAFFDEDVTIDGNLTVNGTTTTVNSATLDVTDTNITVNNGGNDATAEGAGLTVDRTGTSGSLIYENALASKWKAGDLGSESEVITASTTQSRTGAKTFTNKLNVNNELNLAETIDASSTGSSAVVPTTSPSIRLTNASLVSVANIDDVTNGKFVVLSNHTGNAINILNDSGGTAIKRILTGTGSNLTLDDDSTLILSYSSNESRWMVIGGSGSGGSGDVVGPASSLDGEIVLFDSTTGKLIKRATGSGFVKATSGVYSTSASIALGSEVSGTLPVANGGTGQTSVTAAFNALSPSTTKGDIIVHNGTDDIRVAVGANDTYLVADSTQASGVKWGAKPVSTITVLTGGTLVTYNTPAGAKRLRIKMVGAGGGGGPSGTGGGSAAGNGGDTIWRVTGGSNIVVAGGGIGGGGISTPSGGLGGTNTFNSPAITVLDIRGNQGGGGSTNGLSGASLPSGSGGASMFGGAGGGTYGATGGSAIANSGSGGGGGGGSTPNGFYTGVGGGSGGFTEFILENPSSTYEYTVGANIAGGGAGSSGFSGGNSGSGRIVVEVEY
jgi:hypothetical protein